MRYRKSAFKLAPLMRRKDECHADTLVYKTTFITFYITARF